MQMVIECIEDRLGLLTRSAEQSVNSHAAPSFSGGPL